MIIGELDRFPVRINITVKSAGTCVDTNYQRKPVFGMAHGKWIGEVCVCTPIDLGMACLKDSDQIMDASHVFRRRLLAKWYEDVTASIID